MVSENQILKYAIEHGIVDLSTICQQVEMTERNELLNKHSCNIWQDKLGNYITYLPDKNYKNGKRLIKRKNKTELENVIVEHYKQGLKQYTFGRVFNEWVTQKLEFGEIMKQTYDRYQYDYQRFITGTRLDKIRIDKITDDILDESIRDIIHTNNMSAKRWANTRAMIIGTMKFAKRKGYSDFSITSFLDGFALSGKMFKKVIKTDDTQVFTDDETKMVEEYILSQKTSPTNLAILFDFQTGLRVGELSALKYSDIDGNFLNVIRTEERFKDETGHYTRQVREQTKGKDGQRKIVLTQKAIDILDTMKRIEPDSEYIFSNKGERLKGNNISNKLSKICKHIGITPKSIHKIRKTYATNLLSNGVDEKIIERQMGHTDIAITRDYYYFNKHTDTEIQDIITNAIKW